MMPERGYVVSVANKTGSTSVICTHNYTELLSEEKTGDSGD